MTAEISVPAMVPAEIVASTRFGGRVRLDFGDGADMDMAKGEASALANVLSRVADGSMPCARFNTRRREEYGADALVVQALDDGVLMTLNRNTCEFYVEMCLKTSAVAELARWLREASE